MGTQNNERVSVWVLSEFVFCPRAGLIAHRSKFDGEETFQEDDESYGRLDYLPDFDGAAIERAIAETRRLLLRVLAVAVWTAVGAAILGDQVWPGFWWTGLALLSPLPFWAVTMVRRLGKLRAYARQFRERDGREPGHDLTEPAEFNWWDFHRAGFRVVKPRERYHDPELNLDGCPWRVLERGSIRIPVFRKHRGQLSAGRPQFATLAAYSHLIRECEHAESPYGVILYPGTWTVLVVPDRCGSETFRTGVGRFRAMLLAEADGQPPAPPASDGPCSGCRHGQPKRLVTDQPAAWELTPSYWTDRSPGDAEPERVPTIHVIGGRSVRPYPVHGVDGWRYHSLCGDLFEWIPPHDTAQRIALKTTPHPEGYQDDEDEAPDPPVPPPITVVVNNVIAPYPTTGRPHGPPAATGPGLPIIAPPVAPLPPASTVPPEPVRPPPPPAARPDPDDEDAFGAGIL